MKQILRNVFSGETRLVDVPAPQYGKTDVLIQSGTNLISIGTERMLAKFGKANMLSKARQQHFVERLEVIVMMKKDNCRNFPY